MAATPRILIVEDDEVLAGLIALLLEKKGYIIAGKTGSGEDAIRKSVELEPDLILMDVNLNGKMDGVTAARFIFPLLHVPIIFLTAMYDDDLFERAGILPQPYGYLLKPFTARDLHSHVEGALSDRTLPMGSHRGGSGST